MRLKEKDKELIRVIKNYEKERENFIRRHETEVFFKLVVMPFLFCLTVFYKMFWENSDIITKTTFIIYVLFMSIYIFFHYQRVYIKHLKKRKER